MKNSMAQPTYTQHTQIEGNNDINELPVHLATRLKLNYTDLMK